jgi:hypothetical protein
MKSALLWIFALIFTLIIVIYQRATGPTYPQKGKVELNGVEYKYKLLTSHGGDSNAEIEIEVPQNISGSIKFRKFPTNEEWQIVPMKYDKESLIGELPHQPPAGKLEYFVILHEASNNYQLNPAPVIIRFKGGVPLLVLIPHVILMFAAMLLSTRTGMEAIWKGKRTFSYALYTLISLLVGGLILGPIVQEYAFGDYWTGWPFGGDWTDNKTLIAFIFWLIAVLVLRKRKSNRLWPVIAMIALLAVYLIPHSMGGSELDPESGKVTTGMKK